jgi:hypothetical protein
MIVSFISASSALGIGSEDFDAGSEDFGAARALAERAFDIRAFEIRDTDARPLGARVFTFAFDFDPRPPRACLAVALVRAVMTPPRNPPFC